MTSCITSPGHYLYVGSEGYQGDAARLISPHVTSDTPDEVHCWRYYYHMWGQDVYVLELRVSKDDPYKTHQY